MARPRRAGWGRVATFTCLARAVSLVWALVSTCENGDHSRDLLYVCADEVMSLDQVTAPVATLPHALMCGSEFAAVTVGSVLRLQESWFRPWLVLEMVVGSNGHLQTSKVASGLASFLGTRVRTLRAPSSETWEVAAAVITIHIGRHMAVLAADVNLGTAGGVPLFFLARKLRQLGEAEELVCGLRIRTRPRVCAPAAVLWRNQPCGARPGLREGQASPRPHGARLPSVTLVPRLCLTGLNTWSRNGAGSRVRPTGLSWRSRAGRRTGRSRRSSKPGLAREVWSRRAERPGMTPVPVCLSPASSQRRLCWETGRTATTGRRFPTLT